MNAIVLLGPPGAGKGTVAGALTEHGYTHVSTGQLLRAEIRMETPLGIEAKKMIDGGCFVPDEVVVGIIRGLLENAEPDQKFLFDGFPRNLSQAQQLDALFDSLDGELSDTILLECPDKVIVERLSGRRTCNTCGTVYHTVYNPPKNNNLCDWDGSELQQRPDDRKETVQKRLDIYAEHTAPLIEYYEQKNMVHRLDASQSIEEVRKAAVETLG
jgi:adenylate kinase